MKIGIYAGTFDPITNGHLNIIERATRLFDKVIIAIAENRSKNPLFDLHERATLVQQSTIHLQKVEICAFTGLLAELAKNQHAVSLIRGIRGNDDIEYEIHLAQLNHKLAEGLETIFLPPALEWRYLSSTMVREVFRHQGDISSFVPEAVLKRLTGGGRNT